jgi:hypothetical protein
VALRANPADFKLDNLEASIKFTIQNVTKGGLKATFKLVPVSLQASLSVTPTNTHEIVLLSRIQSRLR